MNIAVPVRLMPNVGDELEVDESGVDIDRELVDMVINDFDHQAIEEAPGVRLGGRHLPRGEHEVEGPAASDQARKSSQEARTRRWAKMAPMLARIAVGS